MASTPALKSKTRLVAIVGNPNAGKTTLFNSLTGSHQKVGNYPGVTVEKVAGTLKLSNEIVECIDVPGLYSLTPVSEDERVAVEVIDGRSMGTQKPDLLVCVMDAGNLERNLYFFTQVAEAGHPVVVALTMVDRLEKDGREVDLNRFANLLGVEVIPVVGHKASGLQALKDAIERNLEDPHRTTFNLGLPDVLENKVASLKERLARIGADFSSSEIRHALLDPSEGDSKFLLEFPEMREAFDDAKAELKSEGTFAHALEVSTRYQWAGMVAKAVITEPSKPGRRTLTDKIDFVLTHRVVGLLIFIVVMYLVFQSIYTFAQPVMDAIQWVFGELKSFISPKLASVPILQSLVADGIIGGVGGMLVFLPQILILFFFISMLEGTGYLSRAAFLMDRLLGWCGLNGRAFIPLLSSFACAIPGIMSARVMPDAKSRLATILVAPLMSCSARLPVYLLLISTFIQPKFGPIWAGIALFGMHILGLAIAVPMIWILNRGVIKGKRLPFLLELPPYQWPKLRDVWIAMYFRGRVFVTTAGTTIVAMSILIWALSFFPRSNEARVSYQNAFPASIAAQATAAAPGTKEFEDARKKYVDEQQLAHSYLGRFGQALEPAFRPAGFDWRITTAILSAFPARETVVPSLGIIFNLGGDVDEKSGDLRQAIARATWPDGRPLVTAWTAFGLMVFFALCCQCMSTLATIKRETNTWKWPVFVFTYMTVLAYVAAVAIHQLELHYTK